MQVILVSSRFSLAKSIDVNMRHIVAVFGVFLLAVLFGSSALSWLAVHLRLPMVQAQIEAMQTQEMQDKEAKTKSNLQALAARVGELQAQMVHLDSLGQHLFSRAGVEPPARGTSHPNEGGPFVPAPIDEKKLTEDIEALSAQIEAQTSNFSSMESRLRADMVRRAFLPTSMPVAGPSRLGSPFGVRNDPFGRGMALHEGLDFVAPYGAPVLAAAGGVVVNAGYHHEFGNLVEINHGGELITRYAHMSAIKVTVGMMVRQGQQVGELGSTGRSTGPHLHFEVRKNGRPINPSDFLYASSSLARR
ncbi:MAG: M23 family metallopeptidase [Zoogloeaceae bacterium]|jgi:murein DD-endopeptidase MepM/ murein hydrolase activator NlpD|nr:M23 family metallopeptidase [Zoogloeaceae bacterium]